MDSSDEAITPFRIAVPDAGLADLRDRLAGGGHFPGFEHPEVLVEDLCAFAADLR